MSRRAELERAVEPPAQARSPADRWPAAEAADVRMVGALAGAVPGAPATAGTVRVARRPAARRLPRMSPRMLLRLQRLVGNRAMAAYVQRLATAPTAAAVEQTLASAPMAGERADGGPGTAGAARRAPLSAAMIDKILALSGIGEDTGPAEEPAPGGPATPGMVGAPAPTMAGAVADAVGARLEDEKAAGALPGAENEQPVETGAAGEPAAENDVGTDAERLPERPGSAPTAAAPAPATTAGAPAPATTAGAPAPATTTGAPAPATTTGAPAGPVLAGPPRSRADGPGPEVPSPPPAPRLAAADLRLEADRHRPSARPVPAGADRPGTTPADATVPERPSWRPVGPGPAEAVSPPPQPPPGPGAAGAPLVTPASRPTPAAPTAVAAAGTPSAPKKAAKGTGTAKLKAGGAGGGPAKGGSGGAPKLGDATLEKWKAASAEAKDAIAEPGLETVTQSPNELAQAAADTDASRRAAQPDYEVDAKANQKPPPEEPPREQTLDTTEADAAVTSVEDAGRVKLTDQVFDRIEAPPPYPGLTARDFVPQTLTKGLADIEAQIAAAATPEEKEALDKKADAFRQKIAEVEKKATEGSPTVEPAPIKDAGAASLKPPPPAMGDLLGDALARIMAQVGTKAKAVVAAGGRLVGPPGVTPLKNLMKEYEPETEAELRKELEGVAAAAGVTAEQLGAKVEQLKTKAQETGEAVATELGQKSDEGKAAVEVRGQDESKQVAGATAAVQAEIDAKQQAAEGGPDTEAIERKKEEYLTKAQDVAAQASAALRGSIEKRESEVDAGMREQQHAYDTAADSQAAAIRRHFTDDPDKGRVESRPTVDWGATKQAEVGRKAAAMKTAARAEHEGHVQGVDDAADAARNTIRDWAAGKEGRQRSWWERLLDMFMDWWNQADADNEAWEQQRNAETRDAMVADMDMLVRLRTAKEAQNQEAVEAELAKLTDEQRKIAQQYLLGGSDAIGTVADMTMARIKDRRAPELAKTMEERAVAEWSWGDLNALASKKNPAFNASVIGNEIKGAVAGVGTDEAQLFAALGQVKGKVEKAALDKFYLAAYGTTVEDDVSSDTSGDEWDRAEALMEGDRAAADAAALHYAIAGMGTDEQAIKDVLRGKAPEEREALLAAYKEKYGVELKKDLADEMSGAEFDTAMALAEGNTELADAAELEEAMAGAGTDEAAINATYERIRRQVEAEAESKGMSTAEVEAEIKKRNRSVKKAYEDKYGKSLDAELRGELSGAELELVKAQAAGNRAKIDAATLKVEADSLFYSDDEKIEGVVRNQYERAKGDVERDIVADQRLLAEQLESGDISMGDFKTAQAGIEARKKAKDDAIKDKAKSNMAGLESTYNALPNVRPGGFDRMIETSTSGYNKKEIKALIREGGKLEAHEELFYATAGDGTDEDMIKNTLKGRTADEIEKIKAAYEAEHGKGTFRSDILGDLSGRDQFDVGLMIDMGEPKTPEERIKWLEAKAAYEKEGMLGFFMSETGTDPLALDTQLAMAKEQYAEYEQAVKAGASKEELQYLEDKLGLTSAGVEEAVTQHRKYVDSVTDTASMVGAAVVGVAVTVLTAGTAGPVVAAALGAAYGGMAGIAMKAALKGPAYGWEDMAVDLGMTGVDVALSAATAGMGKFLMKAGPFAKLAAKGGPRAFAAEGMSEVVENVASGMPSAMAGAMMDENTWKSGDPFSAILAAGGQGAWTSGIAAVGIKGAGDAYGGIKAKLGGPAPDVGGPRVDAGTPDVEARAAEVTTPPELDMDAALTKARQGELPDGAAAVDAVPAAKQPAPAEPGPGRKPAPGGPSASGTKKPPPIHDAAALDFGDRLPAETVMMPHPATDAAAARTMYENSIRADPTQEVAIFRNPETGEYIVVQGDSGSVSVDGGQMPEGAHKAQKWKEILDGPDRGTWDLEAHSHPSRVGPGGEVGDVTPSDVFPSGGNGDMGAILHEAASSGKPRSSRIDYTLGGKPEHTMFGVDPTAKEPFWIETPDGAGGRKVERFATLDDYHARLEGEFPEVDLGPVPDWMKGPTAVRDAVAGMGPGGGGAVAAPGKPPWPVGTKPGTGGRPPPLPLNDFATPRQLDAPLDRTKPLGSAGDFGSITSTPGNGVFPATMKGRPVAVKVYDDTPSFRAKLEEEMASLRIAEKTGYGPRVLGIVEVKPPPGIGLAMDRQPGGFIEFDTPTRPLSPADEAAAKAEAAGWRGKVTDDTVRQLDEYFDRLEAGGHVHAGEFSYFVDELGNLRPVDLQGLRAVDPDPKMAKVEKDWHDRLRADAKAKLEQAAADNKATAAASGGGGGTGRKPRVKSTTDGGGAKVADDGALVPGGKAAAEADPLTRPRSADVGHSLTDDMLEAKYGLPRSNVEKLRQFCRDFKLVIDLRPSNVETSRLLDEGLMPKAELLKAKSIRPDDVYLGWKEEDIGKVAHAPPRSPVLHEDWDKLPKQRQDELLDWWVHRFEEYSKYDKELQPYIESGVIEVRDGVVFGRALSGDMVPFTGDHDIFDLRWANGNRLTMDEYLFIRNEMRFRNMGVEHGAHLWWLETVPETYDPGLFKGIVKSHVEGPKGEPLVRLGDGDPKAVWADANALTGPKTEGGPQQNPFADYREITMLDAGPLKRGAGPELDLLPGGTVMEPPNPKDAQAAMDMYQQAVADDMSRDVALFHNPTTGEYRVVQGDAGGPVVDPAVWREALGGHGPGSWVQVAGSKPPPPADAAAMVRASTPVGLALKADAAHRAASFAVDDIPTKGTVFKIVGGDGVERLLIQVLGDLNGAPGRYEWILDGGNLTYQWFVGGGRINGIPSKR